MPEPTRSYPEINRAFSAVLRVKEGLPSGLSRKDQIEILIEACIANGFDTRQLIIKWLRVAGRSPTLVETVLDERTGPSSDLGCWKLGDDGRYTVN